MDLEEKFNSLEFERVLKKLYGHRVSVASQRKRYLQLLKTHQITLAHESQKVVCSDETFFFSSPGRIEVCGNHTDHNSGKVLCASINVDTLACVNKTDGNEITIASHKYKPVKINLNELEIDKSQYGTSTAFLRGVVRYFVDHGYKVGGFYCTTTSDIFKGAGVSSSAAFCVLIATILNDLYNNSKIGAVEKALAAQFAESVYFGKPCGLMDQSAIALGGVSFIDFENTKEPKIEKINWNFDDLEVVLINTGGNHSNLTADYASIREEMTSVANFFNKSTLREVDELKFYKSIAKLQKKVSGRAILRAMHYFNENKRVDKCVDCIKQKNMQDFCSVINESGNSSATLLQNVKPVGDIDQRISLSVAVSKNDKDLNVLASRVHGGGFMGTTISFIETKYLNEYVSFMSDIFGKNNVFTVSIRNDGATMLSFGV